MVDFNWSLDVHLSMYANLDWASLSSWFMCSLLMYDCRLRIVPVWEHVGTSLSQYGIVWAICIPGVPAGLSGRAPLLAN